MFSTGVIILLKTAGPAESAIKTTHKRESVSQDVGGEPSLSDTPCEGDIDESSADRVPDEDQSQTGVHHDLRVYVETQESGIEGDFETHHEDRAKSEPEGDTDHTELDAERPEVADKVQSVLESHESDDHSRTDTPKEKSRGWMQKVTDAVVKTGKNVFKRATNVVKRYVAGSDKRIPVYHKKVTIEMGCCDGPKSYSCFISYKPWLVEKSDVKNNKIHDHDQLTMTRDMGLKVTLTIKPHGTCYHQDTKLFMRAI